MDPLWAAGKILWQAGWAGKVNFKRSSLNEICICFCWDSSKGQSSCQMLTSCPGENWCLKPQVFFPPSLITWGRTDVPKHILLILRRHTCRAFVNHKKRFIFGKKQMDTRHTEKKLEKKPLHTDFSWGYSKAFILKVLKKSAASQLGSKQNSLFLRKQITQFCLGRTQHSCNKRTTLGPNTILLKDTSSPQAVFLVGQIEWVVETTGV